MPRCYSSQIMIEMSGNRGENRRIWLTPNYYNANSDQGRLTRVGSELVGVLKDYVDKYELDLEHGSVRIDLARAQDLSWADLEAIATPVIDAEYPDDAL